MKSFSIIREHEYAELKKIVLNGSILDLGGSRKSGYHELPQGEHTWEVVNYGDMHPGADLLFDLEKVFPLEDASYKNVVSMNLLEHIFNYHNVFSEVSRVLVPGGLFVSAVPFMHHVHGSPNDYHRYTKSTYERLAQMYNFEIVTMVPLGGGLFSLVYQSVGGWIPTDILKNIIKSMCTTLDRLCLYSKKYQKLRDRIPLGYFWVMKKKNI